MKGRCLFMRTFMRTLAIVGGMLVAFGMLGILYINLQYVLEVIPIEFEDITTIDNVTTIITGAGITGAAMLLISVTYFFANETKQH